jgi:EAL domain-containing protein (putative c-di-GMP-specific phosphodiesterase class I)
VVDLPTGAVTGAEALLRWRHPNDGLLAPDQFLADADAIGLLAAIGEQTLRRATRLFAEVNARPGQRPVRVAVNLSASELSTEGSVGRVQAALSDSGLAPDLLVLEIREDVVVDDSTRRTIDQLAALGVVIAIDDFGTGNSSLRQLGSYPASVLKVDRTFVDGLGTDDEDTFIVRALLKLARNLGLQTVAEGIETETQRRLLLELGCDSGQGWLFDRAVPFAEFDRAHLGTHPARHLRPVR